MTQSQTEAYDPMAGTLAALQTPDYRRLPSPTNVPTPCHCVGPQPGEKLCPCALRAASDSFARAQAANVPVAPGVPYVIERPAVNVVVLGLDLGTKLGWAVRARDGAVWHGTEAFTPRKNWTAGQRWLRARSFLTDLIVRHQVTVIAYEDVKRHMGTDAAHAYGAFLCIVQMVADSHRATLQPVGVKTIKKFWTGNGNADKDAMKAEARRQGFKPVDDNDSDALAILSWAVDQEKNHGMA